MLNTSDASPDRALWIPNTVLRKGTGCEVHDALEYASRAKDTGSGSLATRAGYTRVDEKAGVAMAVRLIRSNAYLNTFGNELDLVGSLEVVMWLLDHWPDLDIIGTVDLASRQLLPALIKAAGVSTITWRKVQKIFSTLLDRVSLGSTSNQAPSHKMEKLWSIALSKVCEAACHGGPEDRLCGVHIILDTLRAINRLPKPFFASVLMSWITDDALPALLDACEAADTRDLGIALQNTASDALRLIREQIGSSTFDDLSGLYRLPKRDPTASRVEGASRPLTHQQQPYLGTTPSQKPPSIASGSHYNYAAKLGPASRASTRSGSGIGVFSQESPIAGRPRLPSRRVLSAGTHGGLRDGCGSDASSVISGTGPRPRPRERPAAGMTEGEKSLLETIRDSDGGAGSPARAEVNNQRTTRAVAAVTGSRKAAGGGENDDSPDSVVRKLGFDADNTPPNVRHNRDTTGDAFPSLRTPSSNDQKHSSPAPGSLDGNHTLMTLSPGSSTAEFAAAMEASQERPLSPKGEQAVELTCGDPNDQEGTAGASTPTHRPGVWSLRVESKLGFDCLTMTECPRCGKAFRTRADVQNHMLTCTHRMRSGSLFTARTDDGSLDSLPALDAPALGDTAEEDLMRTPMSLHSVPGPTLALPQQQQQPQQSGTKATPGTGGQTLFVHETPQVPLLVTPATTTAVPTAPRGGASNPLLEAFERVTAAEKVPLTEASNNDDRVPQVIRDPSTSLSPSTSSAENTDAFLAKAAQLHRKASPPRPALASPPSMTAIPEAEVVDWDAEIETFLASVGSSRSSVEGRQTTNEASAGSGGTTSATRPPLTDRRAAAWASRRSSSSSGCYHHAVPARDSTTSCTVEMNCTSMMLSVRDPISNDSNLISRIDHVSHKDLSVLEPLVEEKPYSTTTAPAAAVPHRASLDQPSRLKWPLSRVPSRSLLGGRSPKASRRPLLSMMPQTSSGQLDSETTIEEPSSHHKCPHCGRTFASKDKLGVHERVCQRVFMTKRQPVDFRRHRAKNTALEAFVGSTFAENDAAAGAKACWGRIEEEEQVCTTDAEAAEKSQGLAARPVKITGTSTVFRFSVKEPSSRRQVKIRETGRGYGQVPLAHQNGRRRRIGLASPAKEAELRSSLLSTARKSRGSLLAALARDESSAACLVGDQTSLDKDESWQRRSAELARKYTSWSQSILRSSLEAANRGAEATEEASLAAADLINPWDSSRAPKGHSAESCGPESEHSRISRRAVTFVDAKESSLEAKPLQPTETRLSLTYGPVGDKSQQQQAHEDSLPSSRMFMQNTHEAAARPPAVAPSASSRASSSIEDIIRKYTSMSKVEIVESPRHSRDKPVGPRREGVEKLATPTTGDDVPEEHSSGSSDRPLYDPSKYFGDNSDDEALRDHAGFESYPWSQHRQQPYFHPPLQHPLYMGPGPLPPPPSLLYPPPQQQYQALPCYYYPTVDPQPGVTRMYNWAGPYPTDLAVWRGGPPPRSMPLPGSYGG
ncbi:hypothetical protein FOZ60_007038 [Perkinsus olseni]|uniref:C2H2-type domain-containing protein n=2 Tax=Perkinsus olseni TaxID=32597 RepID=A0A7J6NN89_PEROL|nr:hypothetical protein FOZ60_007038 [Perkinsus olseni]